MREAHPTLGDVLMLTTFAAGPKRVHPALVQELSIRLRNRNRGVRRVFRHQVAILCKEGQSLDGTQRVAILVSRLDTREDTQNPEQHIS